MLTSIWEPAARLRGTHRRALIYLICGNPGLIGYHVHFLSALRNLLDSSQTSTAYDIYGRNLAGFCDHEHPPFSPANPPYDVAGQVDAMYDDLCARSRTLTPDNKPYDLVILMGHSIGAYICVDIFHRHARDPSRAPHLNLRHGFLLFPTIASLAVSRAGTRMNLLRRLPTMEAYMVTYAKTILRVFPQASLRWVLENAMGFSANAADLTAEWLKSRDGVRQALHMAFSELDTIFEDKWDDELWEVSASGEREGDTPSTPRFFMFYGREDHWVANHVRDEFIEGRRRAGEKGGRTSITVDEGNIQHAFCIEEHTSWSVARLVHGWVEEIDRAGEV